ncbi:MAG: hypothetical protein MI919_03825, partial [Holophagales bacterium]|nr:hypothetical protein [Holophagales bacterium]
RCFFGGDRAFRREDDAISWLRRQGVDFGSGNLDKVPYYLLLVGDPGAIPFGADFDLGASHALGRIAFDEPEHYRTYAENVCTAEREAGPDPVAGSKERAAGRPRCAVFAPAHHADGATSGCLRCLVRPLLDTIHRRRSWELHDILEEDATKNALLSLLAGGNRPEILFFAGHGLGPSEKREDILGSLVCSDAHNLETDLRRPTYFSASDVPSADLRGMVAVLFGCHTVGVPELDSFATPEPKRLGPADRFAALPQRLLSQPNGALAVLGHVDRAWSHSYRYGQVPQPETFLSLFGALLDGEPLGAASGFLGDRCHQASSHYGRLLQEFARTEEAPADLTHFWVVEQDARSYLIFGDPAVRPRRLQGGE